jgi:dTDP-4-dehydrorhamnose reductase
MSSLRILQFGASGQLGKEMIAAAPASGIALDAVSREAVDFTRPDDVIRAVRETNADVVVNATAYTSVDKAESEEALARTINAETVGKLAAACAERGLPLIHVSTDYVFDGMNPAPYLETDVVNPRNAYGRTKLEGELAMAAANPRHVILRTSWVYSPYGTNFVKTMLRLSAERDIVKVVDDQHGAPTSAADLAATILSMASVIHASPPPDAFGVFHYTGRGDTSWFGFAREILAGARDWHPVKADLLPIPASEFPTPARRPANSRLDCGKIERVYGIRPVPWRVALASVLGRFQAQQEANA